MLHESTRRHDGGLTGLFFSMIELGDAATKFTFNQMQTAVDIFVDPMKAIDRTRNSMNNFSRALYESAGKAEHTNGSSHGHEHAAADVTGEPLTGRKL
jgi:hypothetical protein